MNKLYKQSLKTLLSDLIEFWEVYSKIEYFLNQDDPSNEMIPHIPYLFNKLIKNELDKVADILDRFELSVNEIKKFEPTFYNKLRNELFAPLHLIQKNTFIFLIENKQSIYSRKKFNTDYLNDELMDLEKQIRRYARKISWLEKLKVNKMIRRHINSLGEEIIAEIPDYFLETINNSPLIKGTISLDDIYSFYSNEGIIWFAKKILEFEAGKALIGEDETQSFRYLSDFSVSNFEMLSKIFYSPKMIQEMKTLIISPEDEKKYFTGNSQFYKLIYGYLKVFAGSTAPIKIRREFIPYINGDKLLKDNLSRIITNIYTQRIIIKPKVEVLKPEE